MRIISKYKDYYDSIQAYGMDKNCVYERKEEKQFLLKPPGFDSLMENLDLEGFGFMHYSRDQGEHPKENLYFNKIFLLGYCGQLIIGFGFHHLFQFAVGTANSMEIPIYKDFEKPEYFFDANEILEHIKTLEEKHKTKDDFAKYAPKLKELNASLKPPLLKKKFTDWFHHFKAPIFLIEYTKENDRHELIPWGTDTSDLENRKERYIKLKDFNKEECAVTLNPKLKDLAFFKVKDPYTYYQDIHQFISGVLTLNEDNIPKSTDTEKVQQHGFDKKYGFRKRPKE